MSPIRSIWSVKYVILHPLSYPHSLNHHKAYTREGVKRDGKSRTSRIRWTKLAPG